MNSNRGIFGEVPWLTVVSLCMCSYESEMKGFGRVALREEKVGEVLRLAGEESEGQARGERVILIDFGDEGKKPGLFDPGRLSDSKCDRVPYGRIFRKLEATLG